MDARDELKAAAQGWIQHWSAVKNIVEYATAMHMTFEAAAAKVREALNAKQGKDTQ